MVLDKRCAAAEPPQHHHLTAPSRCAVCPGSSSATIQPRHCAINASFRATAFRSSPKGAGGRRRREWGTAQSDGEQREVLVYNVCNHEDSYDEVGSQAISCTAGVPAVAAAMLIADGVWDVRGMVNVEELDPRPFIGLMNRMGPVTGIRDERGDRVLDPKREMASTPAVNLLSKALPVGY